MSEEKKKSDLSATLNLPKTDFPMKANLAAKEPEMIRAWREQRVYERRNEINRSNGSYILHDGPPYANGHLHIGHALNKILKDIIVKYRLMKGYYAPYVPGWDCHGLPIELQVDKNLGGKKDEVSVSQKRKLCREYAAKFVDIQRDEFMRMGGFGDWDNPYLTMSYGYEAAIVREFGRFVKNGSVYQGKKPVHWCPSCVTALAEAEVEYADKTSPSVYVKFPLPQDEAAKAFPELAGQQVAGQNAFIVIWTTTPWTLPANLAVAVHPDIDYAAVEHDGCVLVVAEARLEALRSIVGFAGEPLAVVGGEKLVGLKARHPFIDRDSIVIAAEFVSTEDGSGVVHIAPGHGEDDYRAGLANGLEVYAPVDDRGKFTDSVPEFAGQFVFKANDGIKALLEERGLLLQKADITHSYPHCWRCKKPVIFRATEQWFISMSHGGLRERALAEIDRVAWHPEAGRNRIFGMVERRPDWCISRQRAWGVPITLLKCGKCDAHTTDDAALDNFTRLVAEKGADVWFDLTPTELLPDGYKCKKCGGVEFGKVTDILDVWFDSGVSHAAVLEDREELSWPADLYLEGSDQHRGWFQSSLMASVGTRGVAPYKAVLTHGFIVDGQGRKMSKSVGNVVAPQEVIGKNGAEILRLWVSAADYREDIRISGEILNRLVEAYRKIRNTSRYLLSNLYDFDPATAIDPATLTELDKFALSRLNRLIQRVTESYESFTFHEVYHAIYSFCVVDMSSFYLDILKDRLYTFAADSTERRGSQWVMHRALRAITGMMAPILSFTAEEVHKHTVGIGGVADSVFLEDFPVADAALIDDELEARWLNILATRDDVNKALELKRRDKLIGNALEAKVTLYASGDTHALLSRYADDLTSILIVSAASVADFADAPDDAIPGEREGLKVLVERADGQKCSRCWNWRTDVSPFDDDNAVCGRCRQVLAQRMPPA
ncbi:MAG: isoleucine--tRNA ligase [Nitrospirae bacterium]|nr:isoleucine--tRNA ligase [Nitrospirota bacterium]